MSRPADHTTLLSCLHHDPQRFDAGSLLQQDDEQWTEVLALARRLRVEPLLHDRLGRHGLLPRLPGSVRAALSAAARLTAVRNLKLYGALARVTCALAQRGIPLIVLKGGYLAAQIYEDLACRQMGDLDLLVRADELGEAADVIARCGFEPVRRFGVELERARSQHLPPFIDGEGVALELHWTLTPPGHPHPIEPEDLWRGAVPIAFGGISALGLRTEDLLLHLCYHTSFQHHFQFGLRPFCDIAQVVARRGRSIDWSMLMDTARRRRWERGVYLSFELARRLVGAAIPPGVTLALAPAKSSTEMLETAHDLIFLPTLRPNLVRLVGSETLAERLEHLRRRLLLPAGDAEAAPMTRQRLLSAWSRAGALLRRDGPSLVRLVLRRDRVLSHVAKRINGLRQWLSHHDALP
jgi:hypothetical protein